jgi:hypothetical protein
MANNDPYELNDVETPFERAVREAVGRDTTKAQLMAALDDAALCGRPESEKGHGSPFSVDAMVRLTLHRRLSKTPYVVFLDELKNDSDLAASLGFKERLPDASVVSRWERHYYGQELTEWIDRTHRRIVRLAREDGNPMELEALAPTNKSEASPATKSRHRRELHNAGAIETAEIFAEVFELLRAENKSIPKETFFRVLAGMADGRKTAHAACGQYDDPLECLNEKPDDDTLLYHPKTIEPAHIVKMADAASELLMEHIRRYVEFDRSTYVGIDWIEIPISGDPELVENPVENIGEMFEELPDDATGQFVQGVSDKESDKKCYKFIALTIVDRQFRVPLVVRPMPKGVPYALLVRELYWRAREMIPISECYLDAAFYGAGVIWSLDEADVTYVMSAKQDVRIQRWLKTLDHDVGVKQNHGVFGPVEGLGRRYVKTNLVAKPSIRNSDRTVVFATNKDVDDEIGLDRRYAVRDTDVYSRRGQQEKSFELVKKHLPPTRSKNFRVHLLFFTFACAAYTMWKLVDFRVKIDLGVDVDAAPEIKFYDFLDTLAAVFLRMVD